MEQRRIKDFSIVCKYEVSVDGERWTPRQIVEAFTDQSGNDPKKAFEAATDLIRKMAID